jgi:2-polyprenyl-6-methoxyphenol hydroxylase-like FAD-dependent oxidoreductase
MASPCRYIDLPQSQLEPLLVKKATHLGFTIRFNTEVQTVEETDNGILCTVKDLLSNGSYQIRTRFIFGADGGRSTVARSFNLDFHREPSQGTAVNIIFKADLSHIMRGREAQIHWVLRPASDSKFGKFFGIRTVRPSREWVLNLTRFHQEASLPNLEKEGPELVALIKDLVGDETIDVEILVINH